MYEIDYSNMIVRVRVSDSARPPACPKQVFPHTSPPEARNSKKVERSNWLDTQIRCLIDYCIYTFSFFSQKMNYLDKMNMFVCTSHLIIVTSLCLPCNLIVRSWNGNWKFLNISTWRKQQNRLIKTPKHSLAMTYIMP